MRGGRIMECGRRISLCVISIVIFRFTEFEVTVVICILGFLVFLSFWEFFVFFEIF